MMPRDNPTPEIAPAGGRVHPANGQLAAHFAHGSYVVNITVPTHSAKAERELLTRREREVARRAAEGATNAEVAAVMGLTAGTVKTYLSTIYRKLGVSKRNALPRALGIGAAVAPSVDDLAHLGLTVAEAEVARAVAMGMTNKQVALARGSSEGTVKVHLTSINRKCGTRNRSEIAVVVMRGLRGNGGFHAPNVPVEVAP